MIQWITSTVSVKCCSPLERLNVYIWFWQDNISLMNILLYNDTVLYTYTQFKLSLQIMCII